MQIKEVPVLIIGGGIAGLSASIMLGELGTESFLVERHPGTALVPKAHIIHARTMEILQQLGLEEDVRRDGSPPENFSQTSWYTSLGGDNPWDGKLITSVPSWSHGSLEDYYNGLTASLMTNLPQHLMEPKFRTRAEEVSGTDHVKFFHELTALVETEDGVLATVTDRESGDTYQVRATYAIAADGGKTVGRLLGVEMEGPEPFVDVVSMTFDADFSPYLQEDDSLIRLFLQPQLDGSVRRFSIVASGPEPWGRDCRHWRSGVILPVGSEQSPDTYTVEDGTRDLLNLFKVPELEIANLTMSHWLIESVVAERFQTGRTFLVGDAAHRHSPMGGLGLNTGIQDAHNLAWKLDAVVKGLASPDLLATYESERQPVARRRVEFATFSFFNHLSVAGGFGMLPGASEGHNRTVLERLYSDTADGATRRAQLEEMIFTLRREFQHADIDLGYEYADSDGVVSDGTPAPPRDPVGHDYVQVARPGHRVPHAWFERDGQRVATHHLLRPGHFLLLCGEDGGAWRDAAAAITTETGVALDALVVGPAGDLIDADGSWGSARGHDAHGAVLVRPDGHVSFRALSVTDSTESALRSALAVSLGRPVVVPTPADA